MGSRKEITSRLVENSGQAEFGVVHLGRQELLSGWDKAKSDVEIDLISSEFLGHLAENVNIVGLGITTSDVTGSLHLQILVRSDSDGEISQAWSKVDLGLLQKIVPGSRISTEIITTGDVDLEKVPTWYIENFNKKPEPSDSIKDFVTEMRFPGDNKGLVAIGLILID